MAAMEVEVEVEVIESPNPIETSIPAFKIPPEIISDEEMELIESAFAMAFAPKTTSFISSSTSLLQFHPNPNPNPNSVSLLSKRNYSTSCGVGDIEDGIGIRKKRVNNNESFLYRFRRKTGLFVTDITSTEWCEKQKEFYLVCGKPKATKAMKAGSARHAVLEEEVITRVEVVVRSAEEHWALKMINFIYGTNQLLMDGLTRELPMIGFAEGVCVVGIIDEIRMTECVPMLVETKTRSTNSLPSEPQQRNGRLQLMCYKYLWDNLLANPFPSQKFLESFLLKPDYELSKEIQETAIQAGLPAPRTLNDVLRRYEYVCSMLPKTCDELLLRYEYQEDQCLIGENQFLYESDWVTDQIRSSIEFWKGDREASYVAEDERWKCKHCKYASRCPVENIVPSEEA
ncbi:hypothetical protein OSB04_029303 [Centaurea solstitialis]|uniref:Exonuclease V n=1 Tax=Centaurea solstitialis TaxID=347529 RepID=A0AA38VYN6_9ASTR|nr:hypothetical protein OSB04_029303 [Centaurea solstitialis]